MKVLEKTALCAALSVLLFAGWVPLAAQYQGISFGLGGEVNAVSLREDRGYGAAVTVESRLNRYFALAFLGNASLQNNSTLNDISAGTAFIGLEAAAFLRFYFLSPGLMRPGGVEVFLGAGGGVMAVMNGWDVHETRGHPEAAGVLGVRFRLGSRLYLEPYVRGGFPFIGGAGLTVGFRFPSRYERIQADETEKAAETASPLDDTFVFIFAANLALFDTLDEAVNLQNEETLSTVLRLLEENPSVRLLIEGYANPVLGTGKEEWETLRPLSKRRADYIANILVSRGVSSERLVKIGEGGSRVVVPWEDRDHWKENRRVEIRFLR
jgi:outer membrane protein OmpA-like peptidoglycan-associated protein